MQKARSLNLVIRSARSHEVVVLVAWVVLVYALAHWGTPNPNHAYLELPESEAQWPCIMQGIGNWDLGLNKGAAETTLYRRRHRILAFQPPTCCWAPYMSAERALSYQNVLASLIWLLTSGDWNSIRSVQDSDLWSDEHKHKQDLHHPVNIPDSWLSHRRE
jgi:hypothetical protein